MISPDLAKHLRNTGFPVSRETSLQALIDECLKVKPIFLLMKESEEWQAGGCVGVGVCIEANGPSADEAVAYLFWKLKTLDKT